MSKYLFLVLPLLGASFATAREHPASWIEVRSSRFTIVTNSNEKQGRHQLRVSLLKDSPHLKKYRAYHGSDEGWDSVLNTARQNSKPPAGFTISKSS